VRGELEKELGKNEGKQRSPITGGKRVPWGAATTEKKMRGTNPIERKNKKKTGGHQKKDGN